MSVAIAVLLLVTAATAIAGLARHLNLSAPLSLTIAGIAASFLPFVAEVPLRSDVVLLGLLPPLLYAAAIRASLVDMNANRRAIGFLSVALVIGTALAVGTVAWWLIPMPFAAAVALGAVVAPPDAVAATSIARRIGLPRRVVTVLEGESLLNDATALVALRTAIAALAGAVSAWSIAYDFVRAAGGGIVIGIAVAWLVGMVRRRVSDAVLDTSISFLAPFVAYLSAEGAHASGVISVVVAGLVLGHKAPILQSASSRLSERINWSTIQFLLESCVFLLIGLQLRWILAGVRESDLPLGRIAFFCAAVLATTILVRPLWVFPGRGLLRGPRGEPDGGALPSSSLAIISWAGMRGVVTLAAAFILPESTPHREVLVLAAMTVTAGTLLIQGLTLPGLARRLDVRGPDPGEDALQMASLLQAAASRGIEELERMRTSTDDARVVQELKDRGRMRANVAWERLGGAGAKAETPSEQYARLRTAMLAAERREVLRVRDEGTIDHDVLSEVMAALDLEESTIDRIEDRFREARQHELVTPAHRAGACADLAEAPTTIVPLTPEGCPDCAREGTRPVHLRLCLTCGNVGCCDSSPGRHASRHGKTAGHPVIRSFEPGEAWRWCYRHQLLG